MDEHHEALLDFSNKLDRLVTEFKSKLPHEDDILLHPQLRKKLKLARQEKVPQAISSLALPSKRGKKDKMLYSETEWEGHKPYER